MPARTNASDSALVFTRYALSRHVVDLTSAMAALRRLCRSTNHGAALAPILRRLETLRGEIKNEVNALDEMLDPRRADGALAGA